MIQCCVILESKLLLTLPAKLSLYRCHTLLGMVSLPYSLGHGFTAILSWTWFHCHTLLDMVSLPYSLGHGFTAILSWTWFHCHTLLDIGDQLIKQIQHVITYMYRALFTCNKISREGLFMRKKPAYNVDQGTRV